MILFVFRKEEFVFIGLGDLIVFFWEIILGNVK